MLLERYGHLGGSHRRPRLWIDRMTDWDGHQVISVSRRFLRPYAIQTLGRRRRGIGMGSKDPTPEMKYWGEKSLGSFRQPGHLVAGDRSRWLKKLESPPLGWKARFG